ncbi:MAG: epimerase, partial [Candidatus Omnitrophota bacterium]
GRAKIIHLPLCLAELATRILGFLVGDIILTRDEVEGLTANLLVSRHPPLGKTRLSEWLDRHRNEVGIHYASELKRRF